MQLLSDVLPTSDVELTGQAVHVAVPSSSLYLPASHDVHVPLTGLSPGTQPQAPSEELPSGDVKVSAHEPEQTVAPVALL